MKDRIGGIVREIEFDKGGGVLIGAKTGAVVEVEPAGRRVCTVQVKHRQARKALRLQVLINIVRATTNYA